jgi:hypothetical protein
LLWYSLYWDAVDLLGEEDYSQRFSAEEDCALPFLVEEDYLDYLERF